MKQTLQLNSKNGKSNKNKVLKDWLQNSWYQNSRFDSRMSFIRVNDVNEGRLRSWSTAENLQHQVSISSTFYARIFHTNIFFSSYVLALNELSYKKLSSLMLMKLTAGVNFINDLHAHFSYKILFKAKLLAEKRLLHVKFARLM